MMFLKQGLCSKNGKQLECAGIKKEVDSPVLHILDNLGGILKRLWKGNTANFSMLYRA